MKQNKQTQEMLDAKIHKAIKEFCDTTKHPVRTEGAFLAFDFLSSHASAYEIYLHKGEYLFLFAKLVHGLKKVPVTKTHPITEGEQYTPKIMELTDWFISQSRTADSIYKTRLKGLTRLIKDQNLPVPETKYQEWARRLAPKHQRVSQITVLPNPDMECPFALASHRTRRGFCDVD